MSLIYCKGRFPVHKVYLKQSSHSILQALPTNNVSSKLAEIILSLNDKPIEQALEILWNPESWYIS